MLDTLLENPLLSNRYQNEEKWPQDIQDTGCHYFCFLKVIEAQKHCFYHTGWVVKTFQDMKERNIMSSESFIIYPDRFLEELSPNVFQYLGIKPLDFPLQDTDMTVCMYQWEEENLKHFVLGSVNGEVYYDPIEGGSKTVRYGKLKNIRVIRQVR